MSAASPGRPDGNRLYAAGRYVKTGKIAIRVWDRAGLGARATLPAPDHHYAFAALRRRRRLRRGRARLWRARQQGQSAPGKDGVQADMRGKRFEHFTVSADGRRIRFGFKEYGGEPVLFDLTAATLTDAANAMADLTPGTRRGCRLPTGSTTPAPIRRRALPLGPYEVCARAGDRAQPATFRAGHGILAQSL